MVKDMTKLKDSIGKASLSMILGMAVILGGGFFDYSVAIVGAIITISLFAMLIKGESFFQRDRRKVFAIPIMIMCISIIVSFWAIDYMDNFMGIMRIGVICLWMWMIRCKSNEDINLVQNIIPVLGCIMVLISVASLFVFNMKLYFWENNRMSGFFQYANTCGLFTAIGLVILVHNWKERKNFILKIMQLVILVAGLLLTGSRSILLVLLIWGIYYAFRRRDVQKPFFITTFLLILAGSSYIILTGNTENIGRIFTIFSSNSTIWGRVLYARDAIFVLFKKFYGLGRVGYYYSQGTFQTGVYHTRFVHNDFLQIALDYGVIALILLLLFIGWQVFYGKQNRNDKEILLLICFSSLVDFHCQYLSIIMIAVLFLDYGECIKVKKKELRENYIILPALLILFVYIGIATGCSKIGNQDFALAMLPDYTYAQEKKMLSCMGTQEAYEIASKVIDKNPYNITAFITRGSFCASQIRIEECIDDLNQMLELDPYNVEYYKQYEQLLQNLILQLNRISSVAEKQEMYEYYMALLQERIDSLPAQLASLQERTSCIAYKIKDKPVFLYK